MTTVLESIMILVVIWAVVIAIFWEQLVELCANKPKKEKHKRVCKHPDFPKWKKIKTNEPELKE